MGKSVGEAIGDERYRLYCYEMCCMMSMMLLLQLVTKTVLHRRMHQAVCSPSSEDGEQHVRQAWSRCDGCMRWIGSHAHPCMVWCYDPTHLRPSLPTSEVFLPSHYPAFSGRFSWLASLLPSASGLLIGEKARKSRIRKLGIHTSQCC